MRRGRTPIPKGFTLIEILIVMGIMSVMLGFGIGMFRRLSSVGAATQARNTIVQTIEKVKAASMTYPSSLVVDPKHQEVYGQQFEVVEVCNFEPPVGAQQTASVLGMDGKDGTISGGATLRPYPFGHTGGGLVCDQGGSVDFGTFPDFDLTEGVRMQIWVYPTENQQMSLVSKGNSYGVELMPGAKGLTVSAFFSFESKDPLMAGAPGLRQEYRVDDTTIPLFHWSEVIVSYDRSYVTISIDSSGLGATPRFRKAETSRIAPDSNAHLTVGSASGPIYGRVDDFKLAGILAGQHQALPHDVLLKGKKLRRIHFWRGRLDETYHSGPQSIEFRYKGKWSKIQIGVLGNILNTH